LFQTEVINIDGTKVKLQVNMIYVHTWYLCVILAQ